MPSLSLFFCLSLSFCLSLPLSLSLSHTHLYAVFWIIYVSDHSVDDIGSYGIDAVTYYSPFAISSSSFLLGMHHTSRT